MAQRLERVALAEDGRGLERGLVVGGQAIHAGVDQRLDRARQARLRGGAGVEQQLQQEERIALGTLDAAGNERGGHRRRERGEPVRVVDGERAEVDADQRRAMQRRAPCARARVTGEARRHHQQHRLLRGQHGERSQPFERPGIGPVDVLDHEQQRRRRADRGDDLAERMQRSLLARRRAHRRGEGAQLDRRCDV